MSGDIRYKEKAVPVLRLHGKDGDSSDVRHKVKTFTALRLVRTELAVRAVTSIIK